jgi:hypothetical protein
VTFEFERQPGVRYLNVAIRRPGDAQATWVVRNLSVGGRAGDRRDLISTMLDLGTAAPDELVSQLDYGIALGGAMAAAPELSSFGSAVGQRDYRIGGVSGRDPGDPGPPPDPDPWDGVPTGLIIDETLRDLDEFVNQEQDTNDCATGAVSNSLRYLKATGRGGGLTDEMVTMGFWEKKFGRDDDGLTPKNWPFLKKAYFDTNPGLGITTTILDERMGLSTLREVAKALKDGKDVELLLDGHVVNVVGLRVDATGVVHIDIYEDNQRDFKGGDPVRTLTGTLGKRELDRGWEVTGWVIEVPAPSGLVALGLSVALAWRRRDRGNAGALHRG